MILYLLEKMVAIIKYINIECPYCHSLDTSKIGTVGRIASTGLFGLGSSNVAKTMECKNCGYKF